MSERILDEVERLTALARRRQRDNMTGSVTLDDGKFLQIIHTVRADAYARGKLHERDACDRLNTSPLVQAARRPRCTFPNCTCAGPDDCGKAK